MFTKELKRVFILCIVICFKSIFTLKTNRLGWCVK